MIEVLIFLSLGARSEYKVTQNKLKDLEQALAELFQIKNNLHPRQFSLRSKRLPFCKYG